MKGSHIKENQKFQPERLGTTRIIEAKLTHVLIAESLVK